MMTTPNVHIAAASAAAAVAAAAAAASAATYIMHCYDGMIRPFISSPGYLISLSSALGLL